LQGASQALTLSLPFRILMAPIRILVAPIRFIFWLSEASERRDIARRKSLGYDSED